MTLQSTFPVGSTVLNGSHHLAKVIDYRHNELVVEGIGEFANVGKWLANPEMTTRLSEGHFGLSGKYEYFVFGKFLYRALKTNALDSSGYRLGGREQMPLHLVTSDYLRLLGL